MPLGRHHFSIRLKGETTAQLRKSGLAGLSARSAERGGQAREPQGQASDAGVIRLVHAASALANLMGMSVLEWARCEGLSEIAAALPEASSQLTEESFGELTESVLTKVNGVELSLGFGHAE